MRLFSINYNILIKLLLPKLLRGSKMLAWLRVLISPVIYIYNLFTAKKAEVDYYIERTSQLTHMQGVLNDRWDVGLRRITIVDGKRYDPVYIYKAAEMQPVTLSRISENKPVWLLTSAETEQDIYTFLVQVPAFLVFDEDEMIALIDKYNMPGMSYQIQLV